MSETLVYTDVIQRVGYTIVDGVKIVQHTCILPLANPNAMRVSMTKLDAEAYKTHRYACRNDFEEFEDAAFELQEKYTASQTAE